MHRRPLLTLLSDYRERFPDEAETADRIESLVTTHEDCLLRTCEVGHVTASAWIIDSERKHALLTHHRKLDRWLQLGGHVDGEPHVHLAALREAQEESGMERFRFLPDGPHPIPIDLDVHPIPARPGEPAHFHHDVRFLLMAEPGQALAISDESNDLAWFTPAELALLDTDDSVRRMGRKWLALR